jgi:hypothetical protein
MTFESAGFFAGRGTERLVAPPITTAQDARADSVLRPTSFLRREWRKSLRPGVTLLTSLLKGSAIKPGETRIAEGKPAMTSEALRQLYRALQAHASELEMGRGVTSGLDLEILDRRIGAARLLLEWLAQALEPKPQAFPAVQMPPPSSSLAGQDQIPPSAPSPPKNSRR